MKTTNIYILIDPRNNQVRYVGKSNNPRERFKNHLNKSHNPKSYKTNWINKLRELNLKPIMQIIDTVPIEDWIFWEMYWISQFKTWGFNLVNHTNGGDGSTFGNSTSFKKGHKSWNEGTSHTEICNNCGKIYKIQPSISYNRKNCSRKCYAEQQKLIRNTGNFKENSVPWNKGKIGYTTTKGKPVLQFDLNNNFINEFRSCKEAALEINCSGSNIEQVCSGRNKTAKGYKWKYKYENIE